MTPRDRARGWTITLNNYNEEERNNLKELAQRHSEKWIIGKEVGKSGTPHLQAYIYFRQPYDFKRVVKLLNNGRIHLEKAGGTPTQNYKYCSKDGDHEYEGFDIGTNERTKNIKMTHEEAVIWVSEHLFEKDLLEYRNTWGLKTKLGDDGAPYDEN